MLLAQRNVRHKKMGDVEESKNDIYKGNKYCEKHVLGSAKAQRVGFTSRIPRWVPRARKGTMTF